MDSIRAYGPWSVFIGVIIESVIVPIPSPLIIMGAGFVLISADLKFIEALVPILLQIVLPGSIASTLGAYIGYGIGYFGGQVLSSWRLAAVSIGGGPALLNGVMVDGIASDKMFTSGTQTFLTIDSTQEFKILSNGMSAEFGRTGGGIISTVSKSGTNEIHGSAYEFVRNNIFDAVSRF